MKSPATKIILSQVLFHVLLGAVMVGCYQIKLLVLAAMSVHSLFGCGIHAVHAECCPHVTESCEQSCSCQSKHDCEQEKKVTHRCECTATDSHSHPVVQNPATNGNGASEQKPAILSGHVLSHKSPKVPPRQCSCNGKHCVFIVDATKPVLTNRSSPAAVNVELASTVLIPQPHSCRFSFSGHGFDPGRFTATCPEVSQVWLL